MRTKFDDLQNYISSEFNGMKTELDWLRHAANAAVVAYSEEVIYDDQITGVFVRLEDHEALKDSINKLLESFDMRGVN
ncbi:hypothetical protein [Listeria booriae]|uniref:hypothetical protein n=1 Tax=Listeria booriae TaxID=1552123 RepID=UPI001624118F|nr:hypothetical protein [Listeria booriae]MBC2163455.1 hypothetical protein [Listeria booriae]